MIRHTEIFEDHKKVMQEKRLGYLKIALTTIGERSYNNITNLAQDAAKLVTKLEMNDSKEDGKLNPCSYTTLIRNQHYRLLLESYVNGGG
jgi:hypothetical protein|tara:strand:- start:1692 stop:1961 length:270 start_codon:yes stop_codon:yes gene_type:complete